MNQSNQKHDPGVKGRPYMEECDIGSGEKTPAQLETEEMIREIPPLPPTGQADPGERQGENPPRQPSGEQGGEPRGSGANR